MSLYDDLAVPPNADREALTRAHRKAVKRHHPDAGGDREQFERVTRAWLILSDPAKRQRYDQTGQIDDEPDNELARLGAIIIAAFDRVMSEAAEIMDRVDMVARMTARLRADITETKIKISSANRIRGQVENAIKRLSFAGDGPDLIGRALEDRRTQINAQIAAMEAEAATIERAVEHLKLYGWEFDRASAPMFQTAVFGVAGTSTVTDAARRMEL